MNGNLCVLCSLLGAGCGEQFFSEMDARAERRGDLLMEEKDKREGGGGNGKNREKMGEKKEKKNWKPMNREGREEYLFIERGIRGTNFVELPYSLPPILF